MKRLILLLTLLIPAFLCSQSCLPLGITFTTQEQIDNFQTDNPDCSEIEGDVRIEGDNITNLYGLNNLVAFGGDLKIGWYNHSNPNLTNLNGLENVTFIGGDLVIHNNDALTNLTGLDNLTYIQGNLNIGIYLGRKSADNPSLISLTGLENLDSIGGDLSILSSALLNLSGLNNLFSIGGNFDILDNLSLTSLNGLESLEFISGSLLIGGFSCYRDCWPLGNPSLKNLQGLNNLNSLGGDLILYCNDSITSLAGLGNLTYLFGSLRIGIIVSANGDYFFGNHLLTDISAIENIEANSIEELQIVDNISLSMCEIQNICEYLAGPNGEIWIENNATGCNSQVEVEEACEAVSIEEYNLADLTINPNPFSTSTTIEYSLSHPQTVTITFYNQFGKMVDVIEERQQKGLQKVVWTPENLADGIYYFRLQAGEQLASGKVVSVR